MIDPVTTAQWQDAVDLAHAMLAIEGARQYGLITGGPVVDVTRCEDFLARGAAGGYHPHDEAIEEVARVLARGAP